MGGCVRLNVRSSSSWETGRKLSLLRNKDKRVHKHFSEFYKFNRGLSFHFMFFFKSWWEFDKCVWQWIINSIVSLTLIDLSKGEIANQWLNLSLSHNEKNKAGYTANTSRGRGGRGGNGGFPTFRLDPHGPTNQLTDGRTKPLIVASPRLKMVRLLKLATPH